jgi:hypothetical protein
VRRSQQAKLPAKSGADQGPRSTRTCAKSGDGRGKDADVHAQDAPLPFAPRPSRHRPGPRQTQTVPHLQSWHADKKLRACLRAYVRARPPSCVCLLAAGPTVREKRARARTQRRSDLASPESTATPAAFTNALLFSTSALLFALLSSLASCSPRTPARGRGTPRHSAGSRLPVAGTPRGAKACTGPARHRPPQSASRRIPSILERTNVRTTCRDGANRPVVKRVVKVCSPCPVVFFSRADTTKRKTVSLLYPGEPQRHIGFSACPTFFRPKELCL